MTAMLSARGFHPDNVLDQDPKYDLGQKLAIYAIRESAGKVAVATVETQVVAGDTRLQLRIQFIEGNISSTGSTPKSFAAQRTLEKKYVLRSGKADVSMTMTELVDDYVKFLEGAGRLAP